MADLERTLGCMKAADLRAMIAQKAVGYASPSPSPPDAPRKGVSFAGANPYAALAAARVPADGPA